MMHLSVLGILAHNLDIYIDIWGLIYGFEGRTTDRNIGIMVGYFC